MTLLHFAVAGSAVCALLVIYPYAIYPALLRLARPKPVVVNRQANFSASLLFCAYNEEHAMPEKLANIELLKGRHRSLEVFAFDDGSQDTTYGQLSARPDLISVLRGTGRNGKAHGMKELARRASGDILIFTDANVTLREDAVENLSGYFADPAIGGVCGSLRYAGSDQSTTAAMGSIYWRLEEHIKDLESDSGNVMGADGSIFAVRRELYPGFPDTVLDDFTVSMEVLFRGKRLIKAKDVVAYERVVARRGEEFTRKVRIAARAYHTHQFLLPKLARLSLFDRFKYASHKLVRWFGGFFLVLGAIFSLVAVTLISLPAAVILLVMLGSLAWWSIHRDNGAFAAASEIVIAMLATLIGVYRARRGETFAVWNPAKSR